MRQSTNLQLSRPRRERQRGVSLIDALIAIAILSFGLIGMTRMQGRMVTASTDAQLRTTAIQLADELLNTVLVDNTNFACYTLPQTGACASAAATARTTSWASRVVSTRDLGRDGDGSADDREHRLDGSRCDRCTTAERGDRCALTSAFGHHKGAAAASAACR